MYAVATPGLNISQRGNHWSLHLLCYDDTAFKISESNTSSGPEIYDLRHYKTVVIEAIPNSAWMFSSYLKGDNNSRVSIWYFSRGRDTDSNNNDAYIHPNTHDILFSFELDLHERYNLSSSSASTTTSSSSDSYTDKEARVLTVGDIIHCMALTSTPSSTPSCSRSSSPPQSRTPSEKNLTNYPFTTSRSSRDWAWYLLCELGRNKHLRVDQEKWDDVLDTLWTRWPDGRIYTDYPSLEAGNPGPEWEPGWTWSYGFECVGSGLRDLILGDTSNDDDDEELE